MIELVLPHPRQLVEEKFSALVPLGPAGEWVEVCPSLPPAQFLGAALPAGNLVELAVVGGGLLVPSIIPVAGLWGERHQHVGPGQRLLVRRVLGDADAVFVYAFDDREHHHSLTVKASGSTGMTLSTDVSLTTIADIGAYVFHCDSNPLAAEDEILILITKTKILTGSTARISDRYVIATGLDAILNKEDKPRACRSFTAGLEYLLRQEGGTARTIDWTVEQLE